jgi:hypothetical protein
LGDNDIIGQAEDLLPVVSVGGLIFYQQYLFHADFIL